MGLLRLGALPPVAFYEGGLIMGMPISVRFDSSIPEPFRHAFVDTIFKQMGVARCNSLAELSETIKMFHTAGILKSNRVAIMGPSGGDMAMTGDLSEKLSIN